MQPIRQLARKRDTVSAPPSIRDVVEAALCELRQYDFRCQAPRKAGPVLHAGRPAAFVSAGNDDAPDAVVGKQPPWSANVAGSITTRAGLGPANKRSKPPRSRRNQA
jgi:hypothetical protein